MQSGLDVPFVLHSEFMDVYNVHHSVISKNDKIIYLSDMLIILMLNSKNG